MPDCPSCGATLDAGALFCHRCGAAAPPAAAVPGVPPGEQDPTLIMAPDDTAPTVDHAAPTTTPVPGDETVALSAAEAPGAGAEPAAGDAAAPSDDTEATAPLAAAEEDTVVSGGSWTCPSCGAAGASADRFCGRCGTPRPTADAACAACGAALLDDMAFCPRCGARRGDTESAASRDATVVLPGMAYTARAAGNAPSPGQEAATPPHPVPPASARAGEAPPPAPPPPAAGTTAGRGHGMRWAVLAVVVVVLAAIGAGVYFGFFYDRGGPEDAIVPIEPLVSALVPKQQAVNEALDGIQLSEESFASLVGAAGDLGEAVAAARDDAGAIIVDDPQAQDILAAFQSALKAQEDYAAALADLPSDPFDLTAAQIAVVETRATSARSAYAKLEGLAPSLPAMPFPDSVAARFDPVTAQIEEQIAQINALRAFLDDITALFPDSRDERLAADSIVTQLEATEIPPDNAAGQMAAQAVRLRGVGGRIAAIVAPDDQRAQEIAAAYAAAVGHSVTATRQYTRWMRHLWEYYRVSGDWPPEYGIEADTYLDPAYDAAREAQDLAAAAREQLAVQVNDLEEQLGSESEYTADDM